MKLKYEPALDGLRALAVLAVLGFHFAKPLVTGGSLGVDVFFVLSGYLITSILRDEFDDTRRIDYPAFLLRRARRLLPALAAVLAIYWLLCPLLWPALVPKRGVDVAAAAFYVTNLRQTFWPTSTPLSPTWSLSIEEQFYLLWPWALLALMRLPRRHAAATLIAVWAVVTVARVGVLQAFPGPAAYYFTPLHASGLLLGAALGLNPIRTGLGRVALAGLVALILAGRTSSTFVYVQPLAEILAVLVIADPPRVLAREPLRFVGKVSYGVYLWHMPIFWAGSSLGVSWGPATLLGLVAVSILAGAASHYGLERWFLMRARSGSVSAPVTT